MIDRLDSNTIQTIDRRDAVRLRKSLKTLSQGFLLKHRALGESPMQAHAAAGIASVNGTGKEVVTPLLVDTAKGRSKTSRSSKPRLGPLSYQVMCAIDRYIRRYDLRGAQMRSAGPDVLDGWVLRHEVDQLVRKRWLSIVGQTEPEAMCGGDWTARLTDKAIALWWPDRAEDARIADEQPTAKRKSKNQKPSKQI